MIKDESLLTDKETPLHYIYTYAWTKDERLLCQLEQRSFFGFHTDSSVLESEREIDPSRSPFVRERIDVLFVGESVDELVRNMQGFRIDERTFKVFFVKNNDYAEEAKVGFAERRTIARKVGSVIDGEADLTDPDLSFGVIEVEGRWLFGIYLKNEAVWHKHQWKPQSYSTALSTRVARAVANIAVPNPDGVNAIDPCCGIGNVLVEARSMGIDVVGSDYNRLVIPGAKENLAYFGLEAEVEWRDIKDVTEQYDVAIIDMPYNICCAATPEEQVEIVENARRIARKVVFVTIEPLDDVVAVAGFKIVDRCLAKKGTFVREIIVCERE